MPLHEYRCQRCDHAFEILALPRETAKVACPECESEQIERQFGLPARPVAISGPAANCAGDGPPCGAAWCGRKE